MRIRPSASDDVRFCALAIVAGRRRDILAMNGKSAAMKIAADATALYVTIIGHHPNEQCMRAGGNRVCNKRQRLGFVLLAGCTSDVGVAVTKR
jgi:hypothetical protein